MLLKWSQAIKTSRPLEKSLNELARHLPLGPCGAVEKFIVVQRTLEFLVDANVGVLRHREGLVTRATVQSTRLRLHVLHVPPTLATPEWFEGGA